MPGGDFEKPVGQCLPGRTDSRQRLILNCSPRVNSDAFVNGDGLSMMLEDSPIEPLPAKASVFSLEYCTQQMCVQRGFCFDMLVSCSMKGCRALLFLIF